MADFSFPAGADAASFLSGLSAFGSSGRGFPPGLTRNGNFIRCSMNVRKWIKRKYVYFYSKILKEKASPEYIARGWAIGMFCGCLIPFGLQLALSIPVAFLLKGSKIGATLGTLLTNQVTIFFIYPVQCYVGSRIMGSDLTYSAIKDALRNVLRRQDYDSLFGLGWDLLEAFFIGGLLLTVLMTPVTYYAVKTMVIRYRGLREKLKIKRLQKLKEKQEHIKQ